MDGLQPLYKRPKTHLLETRLRQESPEYLGLSGDIQEPAGCNPLQCRIAILCNVL